MFSTLLFLGNLGAGEIFLIIALVVLLFGAKKIPELARGVGKGIREFKDATKDIKDTIEEESKKGS
jgi:sec-independent protein translocase protein TatA